MGDNGKKLLLVFSALLVLGFGYLFYKNNYSAGYSKTFEASMKENALDPKIVERDKFLKEYKPILKLYKSIPLGAKIDDVLKHLKEYGIPYEHPHKKKRCVDYIDIYPLGIKHKNYSDKDTIGICATYESTKNLSDMHTIVYRVEMYVYLDDDNVIHLERYFDNEYDKNSNKIISTEHYGINGNKIFKNVNDQEAYIIKILNNLDEYRLYMKNIEEEK